MDVVALVGVVVAGFMAAINLVFFLLMASDLADRDNIRDMASTLFFAFIFFMNTLIWTYTLITEVTGRG